MLYKRQFDRISMGLGANYVILNDLSLNYIWCQFYKTKYKIFAYLQLSGQTLLFPDMLFFENSAKLTIRIMQVGRSVNGSVWRFFKPNQIISGLDILKTKPKHIAVRLRFLFDRFIAVFRFGAKTQATLSNIQTN